MIVGLPGTDLITGRPYPAFTIRTFIANCVNQSLGNVTYGGASFHGRIDCCSTSLCNTSRSYFTWWLAKHPFSSFSLVHPCYTRQNSRRWWSSESDCIFYLCWFGSSIHVHWLVHINLSVSFKSVISSTYFSCAGEWNKDSISPSILTSIRMVEQKFDHLKFYSDK